MHEGRVTSVEVAMAEATVFQHECRGHNNHLEALTLFCSLLVQNAVAALVARDRVLWLDFNVFSTVCRTVAVVVSMERKRWAATLCVPHSRHRGSSHVKVWVPERTRGDNSQGAYKISVRISFSPPQMYTTMRLAAAYSSDSPPAGLTVGEQRGDPRWVERA